MHIYFTYFLFIFTKFTNFQQRYGNIISTILKNPLGFFLLRFHRKFICLKLQYLFVEDSRLTNGNASSIQIDNKNGRLLQFLSNASILTINRISDIHWWPNFSWNYNDYRYCICQHDYRYRQSNPHQLYSQLSERNRPHTHYSHSFSLGKLHVWCGSMGHNLNAQQRYFDVVFEQITSNYGQNYTYTKVPLVECTRQHWSLLSSVVDNYERLKVGNWMCPEIGTKIQLQGKYSSAVYKQYSITLYPCNNDTDPSRLCAPSQQIDAFLQSNGQWNYFSYYYINSIINPDQPDYKHYYLQDRSWIVFGKQLGAQFDIYVSSIDISSDNSIWPFSDMIYQEATNVDYNPILYSYTVSNDTSYANFFVMKDPNHQTYNRQVQKIFVVFSFMGGLIGAVMAGLIIMNTYTSFAFELALAIDIFKDNQTTNTHKTLRKQSKGTVNIFHFFSYSLYHILKKFKKDIDWPFIEYIQECRKQILCQLDIKGLIKRIIFLEYCISYILEDYHLSQMHNQKPYLPEDVRKLREKFQAPICQQNQQNLSEALSNQSSKHVKMAQIVPMNECGLQTYEQFGTARQNDLSPQELSYKINVQQIEENSLPKLESKQENDLWKKRSINIKKLTVSAKQGNLISQKLLQNMSVHKHNELQSMMLREAKQLSLRMPNFKYGSFKET